VPKEIVGVEPLVVAIEGVPKEIGVEAEVLVVVVVSNSVVHVSCTTLNP